MTDFARALLSWESFYVIVGSSGGALIGLQFVVITLISDSRHPTTARALGAFGTPTVVHLTGALLLSAIMSVPWHSPANLSIVLGMCGLLGLAYGALVVHRARGQTEYEPVWQDWLWYAVLPFATYAALIVTAFSLRSDQRRAVCIADRATDQRLGGSGGNGTGFTRRLPDELGLNRIAAPGRPGS